MRDLVRVARERDLAAEPYEVDGAPAGEVRLLRRRDTVGEPMLVGIYEVPVEVSGEYTYEHDDSFLVLAGEVDVWLGDGTELHITEGQMATFRKGQTVRYVYRAGFKKFFVQSGY